MRENGPAKMNQGRGWIVGFTAGGIAGLAADVCAWPGTVGWPGAAAPCAAPPCGTTGGGDVEDAIDDVADAVGGAFAQPLVVDALQSVEIGLRIGQRCDACAVGQRT